MDSIYNVLLVSIWDGCLPVHKRCLSWEEQSDQAVYPTALQKPWSATRGWSCGGHAGLCMDLKAFARQVSCGRRVGKGELLPAVDILFCMLLRKGQAGECSISK